jgi:hypothetical protein
MAGKHGHENELEEPVKRGESHGVHDDMLVEIAFHTVSSNSAHYANELTQAQDG